METTTRTQFVIQQRWNDRQDWQDARYARVGRTIEQARENRARYLADCAKPGVIFEVRNGEQIPVPHVRIQQRVSIWTVVE